MTGADFDKLFSFFTGLKVGVIGDAMLDTYWWGRVERISPEAPVPVVTVTKKEQRIGGAGNVALNVAAMNAKVSLVSVVGDDDDAEQLISLLQKNNIETSYLFKSKDRVTTNKIRIISRNQHMMRLDAEITNILSQEDDEALFSLLKKYIIKEKPAIVILQDYNKGVLSTQNIEKIIGLCKEHNVLTAVDPKRKNFFSYKGVDIFKPNLNEAKEGLNIIADDVNEDLLHEIHNSLSLQLSHKISFITLSEKGVFYENGKSHNIIPTHIRSIADVSGAGDTVIAVCSVVYAATQDVHLMAEVANIAGGMVCEEVGTVAVDKEKLLAECKTLLT
ncbi:MAG: bifunctional ADP-heptose synthase [Ferruginibacter sp.]